MKKTDLIFLFITLIFLSFLLFFEPVRTFYHVFNREHPFWMSFLKFAVLSTTGEIIALRIVSGKYYRKGFGIIPRALVWGFLGMTIQAAFIIFSHGTPYMLSIMGLNYGETPPTSILHGNFLRSFSFIHLITAFSVSVVMNLFFAPVMMTFHKITDTHIYMTGGSLRGFFSPMKVSEILRQIDWDLQWNFVFKKTIPLFWIPAHTITFLLPAEMRILFAALLGVALGLILAFASLRSAQRTK